MLLVTKKVLDTIYKVCVWISGLSILIMSLVIPFGVFTRYVLGIGSSWPEPVAILLMITFTFFGAAASYRNNAHIAVQMVIDRLPAIPRKVTEYAVDVLMLTLSLFLVYYGFKLSYELMRQSIAQLPWLKVGVTYSPIPMASAVTVLFILEKIFIGLPEQETEEEIEVEFESFKAEKS